MNHEQAEAQTELLRSEEFEQRVVEIVVANLRKNGPIRMALVGLYPESDAEKKLDE